MFPSRPIKLDPILGTTFDDSAIYAEIARELYRESEIWERMFGRATSTWAQADKPRFTRSGQGAVMRGGPVAGVMSITLESSSKPWIWVEGGTSRRKKAIMSSNYRPKTRPRSVGSGAGAGRVLYIQNRWRSGITARDVRFVIAERRRLPFERNMRRRIEVGLTKSLRGRGSRAVRQSSFVM